MTNLANAIDAPRDIVAMTDFGEVAYYHNSGQSKTLASDTPLLLLHSINAAPSAMEVKTLFEAYRESCPVYAPDLPGFGASQRPDTNYDSHYFSQFIDRFVREVIGSKAGNECDIVVMSTTAEFVARAIIEKQTPCRSVAMISPTGFTNRKMPGQNSGDKISSVLRLPLFGSGLFKVLTTKPSVRYFLGLSFEGSAPEELVNYALATAKHPDARFAPFSFVSGKLFDPNAVENLYAKLTLPVQVLYDKDPNLTFEKLPALAAANDNWQLAKIAGSKGLPHWTHLPETTAALDEFWAALTSPP